jgi:hypothetical protein
MRPSQSLRGRLHRTEAPTRTPSCPSARSGPHQPFGGHQRQAPVRPYAVAVFASRVHFLTRPLRRYTVSLPCRRRRALTPFPGRRGAPSGRPGVAQLVTSTRAARRRGAPRPPPRGQLQCGDGGGGRTSGSSGRSARRGDGALRVVGAAAASSISAARARLRRGGFRAGRGHRRGRRSPPARSPPAGASRIAHHPADAAGQQHAARHAQNQHNQNQDHRQGGVSALAFGFHHILFLLRQPS